MYTVGLQTVAGAFLHSEISTLLLLSFFILVILRSLVFSIENAHVDDVYGGGVVGGSDGARSPVSLPGSHLLLIIPFFKRRFDFFNAGFLRAGQPLFQFNLLVSNVVAVSGEAGRKAFFENRAFDLTEGFKVLSGALPTIRGVTSDPTARRVARVHKRLSAMQNSLRLSQLIPAILEDCRAVMEMWPESGTFDPFERVYQLIFQTTVRSLACDEMASPDVVSRLKSLYHTLDCDTTPSAVLLPWLPTPSMLRKLYTTKKIYTIVAGAVDARVAAAKQGFRREDTLQMLLDAGEDRIIMIAFIMGLLIAGARATGTTASWIFTFLGYSDEWRTKAADEVGRLLAIYSPLQGCTPSASLSSELSTIPLEAWESATPTLDAFIRETLRIAQPHVAMRRNLGPDALVAGKIVPAGAYAVYPFSDVHLNPDIYPDPWRFDPGRLETKVRFGYIGWGAGATICLGQRLARLELKLVMAMVLLGFRHNLVGLDGRRFTGAVLPDWNDALFCRPMPDAATGKREWTVRLQRSEWTL